MSEDKTLKAIVGMQTPNARPKAIEEMARTAQRWTEQVRLVEENSAIGQIREQLRAIKDSPGLAQMQETMRLLEENSWMKRMLDDVRTHQELVRTALGPIWELRQAGIFAVDAPWRREMEIAKQAMDGFEARFRLPEVAETARLLAEFKASAVAEELALQHEKTVALQRAMEDMSTPWLDAREAMRSMGGLAEMQGIGHVLRTMPPFDESSSVILRTSLGDWRDEISWRPEIFTDLAARADFYVGLGFNPALTEFPLPAFEQGLDIAALRELQSEAEPEDDEEEVGLVRTNAAHAQLQRMERLLRRFINERMTENFGADWPKHQLPNGFYDDWREKKRKAEEAGAEERALIEYADFAHYAPLICRGDNWRAVFQRFFVRQESVRESFQRLHPIRLDIAHARLITQDDELLLCVEVKRLVKVIRRS